MACKVRTTLLRGSDAARKGLSDRMQAVQKEESSEQQAKVRYDERFDEILCEGDAVNGSPGEDRHRNKPGL